MLERLSNRSRIVHENARDSPQRGVAARLGRRARHGRLCKHAVRSAERHAGGSVVTVEPARRCAVGRHTAAGADFRRAEVRREARRHADGHRVRKRLQRCRPAHLEQAGRQRQAAHGAGAAHRQAAAVTGAGHGRNAGGRIVGGGATRLPFRPLRRMRATVRSSRKRSGMRAASRSSGPRAARSSTASGRGRTAASRSPAGRATRSAPRPTAA